MASDDDYMAFLDKANRDPAEGTASALKEKKAGAVEFKAVGKGVSVPEPLVAVAGEGGRFYTSDADEPFVPVALKLGSGSSGLPDEEELAKLIGHPDPAKAEVEIMDPVDWDAGGQYKDVIDAVRRAGEGNDVRVYRVAKGGVRAEYWVLTTTADARLVGLKALAVES